MTRLSKETIEELDFGIKNFIIRLNKKGYLTEFSCSGHGKRKFSELDPGLREYMLCLEAQFGIKKESFDDEFEPCEGYIYFKKKRDAKKVLEILKQSKIGPYLGYCKRFNLPKSLIFTCIGMSKKKINRLWADAERYF